MVRRTPREVRIFVEGGGDDNASLKAECRKAFKKLLERAGFAGRLPSVIACGGRQAAYEQFKQACREDRYDAVLLVDSEALVSQSSPWEHVRRRVGDGWERPAEASDDDLHFMAQCMEAWIVADRAGLRGYFGEALHDKALPARADLEQVAKLDLYHALSEATQRTSKGRYGKGRDSFKLLAVVDPAAIRRGCPTWGERFFADLARRLPAVRG